jgi:PAP2 superfamily
MAVLLRTKRWFSRRHGPVAEATLIAAFYASYEAARGLVAGTRESAIHRAHEILTLERTAHLFAEPQVQRLARDIPGLLAFFSLAYLTLHLAITGGVLIWLYYRRPGAFPLVRTTLIIASVLSLIGFLAFPTAPPRLAAIGLRDSVSHAAVNLNHGLISSLYNPYAAVPSMHIAYALIVAAGLVRYGRRAAVRCAAALYPLFVLLLIVATGNHFFFDAATAVIVAAAGALLGVLLTHENQQAKVATLAPARDPITAPLERAA